MAALRKAPKVAASLSTKPTREPMPLLAASVTSTLRDAAMKRISFMFAQATRSVPNVMSTAWVGAQTRVPAHVRWRCRGDADVSGERVGGRRARTPATACRARLPLTLLAPARRRHRQLEVELQSQPRHGQHRHVAALVRRLLWGRDEAVVALQRHPRLRRGGRHRRQPLRVGREALRRLQDQQAVQRKARQAVARERGLHLRACEFARGGCGGLGGQHARVSTVYQPIAAATIPNNTHRLHVRLAEQHTALKLVAHDDVLGSHRVCRRVECGLHKKAGGGGGVWEASCSTVEDAGVAPL